MGEPVPSSSSSSSSSTSSEPAKVKEGKDEEPRLVDVDGIRRIIKISPLSLKTEITGEPEQGVFVHNPWKFKTTKIGPYHVPEYGKVTRNILPVPPTALVDKPPEKDKALFSGAGGHKPEESRAAYLSWGLGAARGKTFWGQCDEFACVTASLLVATGSPLAKGMTVALFGRRTKEGGHAFVVVNRAKESAVTTPSGWGDDCVIIDQWYALQTGTDPVMYATGPSRDKAYLEWLTLGTALSQVYVFTSGTSTFKIPLDYRPTD